MIILSKLKSTLHLLIFTETCNKFEVDLDREMDSVKEIKDDSLNFIQHGL